VWIHENSSINIARKAVAYTTNPAINAPMNRLTSVDRSISIVATALRAMETKTIGNTKKVNISPHAPYAA
jgi:hypothetical protein